MRPLILLFYLFLLPIVSHAQELSIEQQADRFVELASLWEENCSDDSNLLANAPIDCAYEWKRLEILYNDLAEKEFFSENEVDDGVQCLRPTSQSPWVLSENKQEQFGASLLTMIKATKPDNQCIQQDSQCVTDLYCNAFKSFIPGGESLSKGLVQAATVVYRKLDLQLEQSSALTTLKQCADNQSGSCMRSIFRGIFDSIFSTLDAVWQLSKTAVSSGWEWIKSAFVESENLQSEKLLLATQMNDSLLDQFLQDPLAMIQKMATSIYQLSMDAIKNHYGCEKWDGEPMASRCLIPMQTWECADCTQKMNAVCGVLGFAGGEIITSFLTGGMVGAAKTALSPALKVGAKGLSSMAPLLKPLKQVSSAGLSTATTLAKHHWQIIKSSPVGTLAAHSKKGLNQIAATKSFKVATALPVMAGRGVKEYFSLMDKAFVSGIYAGESAASKMALIAKLPLRPELLRAIEASSEVRTAFYQYPETVHFLFSNKEQAKSLELYLTTLSPEGQVKFSQLVTEMAKRKLPADQLKWRNKLFQAIRDCHKF